MVYGPNPIQKTGSVTVPRELMSELGLELGDRVHWALNPELPGTLLLIPSKMVARSMADLLDSLRNVGG